MPHSLCVKCLLKLILAAWRCLPLNILVGQDKRVTAEVLIKVHTFSHQNKCRLTDLCTDAHWTGDDLQITMMVLVIRGETVEFTMFTLLIPFYQKTEITLKVPSAFSQLSLPLIQIIASFISKLLHLITLLFPFLFPSLAFLLPFIHPLCCFHSISPFPNSTVYSSLCPSSIVHLQGILHIISICFVSLPSSLSLSHSLICPGVFCSIYHLDDTLPLFINTLCRSLHMRTPACLHSFLLSCIYQSLACIYPVMHSNLDASSSIYAFLFLNIGSETLPILFVSFLIISSLCSSHFMCCQKLPANKSGRSLDMLSPRCLVTCVRRKKCEEVMHKHP